MHVIFETTVAGLPKGQPRPRAFVRGGRAAVYDPGTAEGWKSTVAVACHEIAGRCLPDPVGVSLTFYMPRPKSHFRANGSLKPAAPALLHTGKPDADNLAKAVLDALTGIRAWIDDSQVVDLRVLKWWEQPGEMAPGCVVRISDMNAPGMARRPAPRRTRLPRILDDPSPGHIEAPQGDPVEQALGTREVRGEMPTSQEPPMNTTNAQEEARRK